MSHTPPARTPQRPGDPSLTKVFSTLAILATAQIGVLMTAPRLANAAFPQRRRATLHKAVQFRLSEDLARQLANLEQEGEIAGHSDFNRSNLVRIAVEAYTQPLIDLVEANQKDGFVARHEEELTTGDAVVFGETVRVRLGSDLIGRLDRVEAYARGIGLRQVTRSSLIRAAITALLEGAAEADATSE